MSAPHNHSRSRVDRQATGRVPASDEDNTSRREDMEEGMEFASKVTKKSKRTADRMDRSEGSVMDPVMASSAESDTGTMSG